MFTLKSSSQFRLNQYRDTANIFYQGSLMSVAWGFIGLVLAIIVVLTQLRSNGL